MSRPGRQLVLDVLVAAVFVVAGQLELRTHVADGAVAGAVWLNSVVSFVVCAPLALRHVRPLSALATSCLVLTIASIGWAHSVYFWTDLLPLTLLVWTASAAEDGAVHRSCWTLPVVAVCSDMLRVDSARDPANAVMAVLLYAGTSVAARVAHRYAEQRRELREALVLLEAELARQEQDAVVAERVRIAGEIHDVVAHALGVMTVQIGAARLGLERARFDVPEQLSAAERSARQALTDLRTTVDVRDPDEASSLAPMPGLAEVPALVDGFRDAGLVIDLVLEPPSGVGASLELTLYRVLQEALTNAAKYADPPHAWASVRAEGSGVVVDVVNGTSRHTRARLPAGGHGLVGMRERVNAFGGRLEADRTEGGFHTRAVLPVAAPAVLAEGPVA